MTRIYCNVMLSYICVGSVINSNICQIILTELKSNDRVFVIELCIMSEVYFFCKLHYLDCPYKYCYS